LGGWYTDIACTTAWNFAADAVTANMTLYAKWIPFQPVTVTDPRYTIGLSDVVIISPPSDYIKVSNTEYGVPFGGDFSFRPEYDYPYTDAATTVTVNGERIYPDVNGIYTVKNIREATVIDILPGIGIAPPIVQRRVDIVGAEGVTVAVYAGDALIPGPGRFYVNGHDDFVFIAGYNGNPPLKVMAKGFYSGKNIELIGHDLGDGTYRYVLIQVAEPWTITFGPDPASEVMDNEAVSKANVYAYGNTLYITSAVGGEARIYNVTGVLVKIQPYIAGETAKTTLAKGIYIVVMEGKSWKVVISH
jgi:uncharacterized repeat protein (TIGR02543 family)